MIKEFKLPELGENVASGTLGKLLVKVGDVVAEGQNVLEIETDKAVAEIPSGVSGKITEIPDFDDRGCRTQVIAEVDDARKMARQWGSGLLDEADMMTLLHRVVFYGNHVNDVEDLGALMGFEATMEG